MPGVTEMVGVEHLGQYVFEMTQAKVEALKKGEAARTDSGAFGLEPNQEMRGLEYDRTEGAVAEMEEDERMDEEIEIE